MCGRALPPARGYAQCALAFGSGCPASRTLVLLARAANVRGRNDLLSLDVAPHSSNVCARNLRLGLRLRHCSRAARRRRSISRASKASAHCAYAAGTWQSMAAHRLWRLVCHRQCCQSLTCVLEPQQAAAAAAVAACCCLIQSSQRRSEACRIRAVWYLLCPEAERFQTR